MLWSTVSNVVCLFQENPEGAAVPRPLSQQQPDEGVGPVPGPKVAKISEKLPNASQTGSDHQSRGATPTKAKIQTPPPPSPSPTHPSKDSNTLIPFPVPNSLYNCDISKDKDAMSALSRAKSQECKELIRNVTCANKAGQLYNKGIKLSCPRGRYGGKGVENIPFERGKGPPVRVVFLFSVHGRAVRQVKRLFKAIYHVDHYYYIHVDSGYPKTPQTS